MTVTPEVHTLQDAIDHIFKVRDRDIWEITSMPETQYALVLIVEAIMYRLGVK